MLREKALPSGGVFPIIGVMMLILSYYGFIFYITSFAKLSVY